MPTSQDGMGQKGCSRFFWGCPGEFCLEDQVAKAGIAVSTPQQGVTHTREIMIPSLQITRIFCQKLPVSVARLFPSLLGLKFFSRYAQRLKVAALRSASNGSYPAGCQEPDNHAVRGEQAASIARQVSASLQMQRSATPESANVLLIARGRKLF